MAIFKNEAVKPRNRDFGQAQNFGLPLRVTSIRREGDAIEIAGVALATTPLAPEGEEVRAQMSEANFTKQLGHNMALSFKTFDKGEDRFVDSEVILTRAYEKEGQIYAYGGTVTKYVMRGETERDYGLVPNVTVGQLKIKLLDHTDGSSSQLTVRSVQPGEPITLRMSDGKSNSVADVDAGEVVSVLRSFSGDQAARIEGKQSGWRPGVIVTMTAYLPEQAALVGSVQDLQADQNVMLRSEGGEVHYVFPSSDEAANAKVWERAEKFIAEHGNVEAIPVLNLRVSNSKAAEVAEAFAGYIETRGQAIDSALQWKKWQKVLSEFNAFDGQFNRLHLALSSHAQEGGRVVNTIERTVPATNRGMEKLPSLVFNAPAVETPEVAAPAASAEELGASADDFATEAEAASAPDINISQIGASRPAAPAPRSRGLGM